MLSLDRVERPDTATVKRANPIFQQITQVETDVFAVAFGKRAEFVEGYVFRVFEFGELVKFSAGQTKT